MKRSNSPTTSGARWPHRFHRAARAEYRAALAWYAARSFDAAEGFAKLVVEWQSQKAGRAAWRARNREAIAGYNARVEQHGVFSDRWWRL